ncbi:MAG: hypothetical protein JWO59_47 [Chloroflexi bacterium]|nr:hypothetical protein [Chloroflexota bacterium]
MMSRCPTRFGPWALKCGWEAVVGMRSCNLVLGISGTCVTAEPRGVVGDAKVDECEVGGGVGRGVVRGQLNGTALPSDQRARRAAGCSNATAPIH